MFVNNSRAAQQHQLLSGGEDIAHSSIDKLRAKYDEYDFPCIESAAINELDELKFFISLTTMATEFTMRKVHRLAFADHVIDHFCSKYSKKSVIARSCYTFYYSWKRFAINSKDATLFAYCLFDEDAAVKLTRFYLKARKILSSTATASLTQRAPHPSIDNNEFTLEQCIHILKHLFDDGNRNSQSAEAIGNNLTKFLQSNKGVYSIKEKINSGTLLEFCLDQYLNKTSLGTQSDYPPSSRFADDHHHQIRVISPNQQPQRSSQELSTTQSLQQLQRPNSSNNTSYTNNNSDLANLQQQQTITSSSHSYRQIHGSDSRHPAGLSVSSSQLSIQQAKQNSSSQLSTNRNETKSAHARSKNNNLNRTRSTENTRSSSTTSSYIKDNHNTNTMRSTEAIQEEAELSQQQQMSPQIKNKRKARLTTPDSNDADDDQQEDAEINKSTYKNNIPNSESEADFMRLTHSSSLAHVRQLGMLKLSENQLVTKNFELGSEVKLLRAQNERLIQEADAHFRQSQTFEQLFLDLMHIAVQSEDHQDEVSDVLHRYEQIKQLEDQQPYESQKQLSIKKSNSVLQLQQKASPVSSQQQTRQSMISAASSSNNVTRMTDYKDVIDGENNNNNTNKPRLSYNQLPSTASRHNSEVIANLNQKLISQNSNNNINRSSQLGGYSNDTLSAHSPAILPLSHSNSEAAAAAAAFMYTQQQQALFQQQEQQMQQLYTLYPQSSQEQQSQNSKTNRASMISSQLDQSSQQSLESPQQQVFYQSFSQQQLVANSNAQQQQQQQRQDRSLMQKNMRLDVSNALNRSSAQPVQSGQQSMIHLSALQNNSAINQSTNRNTTNNSEISFRPTADQKQSMNNKSDQSIAQALIKNPQQSLLYSAGMQVPSNNNNPFGDASNKLSPSIQVGTSTQQMTPSNEIVAAQENFAIQQQQQLKAIRERNLFQLQPHEQLSTNQQTIRISPPSSKPLNYPTKPSTETIKTFQGHGATRDSVYSMTSNSTVNQNLPISRINTFDAEKHLQHSSNSSSNSGDQRQIRSKSQIAVHNPIYNLQEIEGDDDDWSPRNERTRSQASQFRQNAKQQQQQSFNRGHSHNQNRQMQEEEVEYSSSEHGNKSNYRNVNMSPQRQGRRA